MQDVIHGHGIPSQRGVRPTRQGVQRVPKTALRKNSILIDLHHKKEVSLRGSVSVGTVGHPRGCRGGGVKKEVV